MENESSDNLVRLVSGSGGLVRDDWLTYACKKLNETFDSLTISREIVHNASPVYPIPRVYEDAESFLQSSIVSLSGVPGVVEYERVVDRLLGNTDFNADLLKAFDRVHEKENEYAAQIKIALRSNGVDVDTPFDVIRPDIMIHVLVVCVLFDLQKKVSAKEDECANAVANGTDLSGAYARRKALYNAQLRSELCRSVYETSLYVKGWKNDDNFTADLKARRTPAAPVLATTSSSSASAPRRGVRKAKPPMSAPPMSAPANPRKTRQSERLIRFTQPAYVDTHTQGVTTRSRAASSKPVGNTAKTVVKKLIGGRGVGGRGVVKRSNDDEEDRTTTQSKRATKTTGAKTMKTGGIKPTAWFLA